MNCPWCDVTAEPRKLHEHLTDCHGEQVRTRELNGRVLYQITCPLCGAGYEHLVRKAARDPAFLTGFERQIQMVAMDMLAHHLMAEHETALHPRNEEVT